MLPRGRQLHHFYAQIRDPAKVRFVIRTNQYSEAKLLCGSGDTQVISGNHRAAKAQMREQIGPVFCRLTSEVYDWNCIDKSFYLCAPERGALRSARHAFASQ